MDKMTLREYRIRKEAHRLDQADTEYDRHWRAWLNWNVQGTKKHGKKIMPVYRTFSDFYDRKKNTDSAPEDERKKKMKEAAKKQRERREQSGNL